MCSQQLGCKVIFIAPIQSNNLFRNTTIANYHNIQAQNHPKQNEQQTCSAFHYPEHPENLQHHRQHGNFIS